MARFDFNNETLAIVAGAFQLAFQGDGERWPHQIAVGERVLALSQESDPDRDDPARIACPTYQQCHAQTVPNATEALLVGLWGAHHCSGVFHVEERDSGEARLDVDVAVRSRSPLLGLASTYRIRLTSQDLVSADFEKVIWRISEPVAGELSLIGGEETRIVLAEAGRRETVVQIDRPLVGAASTRRLTYTWIWKPFIKS